MKCECKFKPRNAKEQYKCSKCEHHNSHEQTPSCFIRCCDIMSKDIRCIRVD